MRSYHFYGYSIGLKERKALSSQKLPKNEVLWTIIQPSDTTFSQRLVFHSNFLIIWWAMSKHEGRQLYVNNDTRVESHDELCLIAISLSQDYLDACYQYQVLRILKADFVL